MPLDDYLVPLDDVLIDAKAKAQFQYFLANDYKKEIEDAEKRITAAVPNSPEYKREVNQKEGYQRRFGQLGNDKMKARNEKAAIDNLKSTYKSHYRAIGLPADATPEVIAHYRAHIKKNWAAKDPTGAKAIVWRSDSRGPDTIFSEGFSARDLALAAPSSWYQKGESYLRSPTFRTEPENMDIDPGGGVCLAVNVDATAFFPLNTSVTQPWVYAMVLAEGYNTYRIQKEVASQTKDVTKIWKYKERVACTVTPYDVLAAVQMTRRFTKPGAATASDIQEGVQYKLEKGTLKTSWWGWLHHGVNPFGFSYTSMMAAVNKVIDDHATWSPTLTYSLSDSEKTLMEQKLRDKGML
jgi:hypothetical protein